jgi:hypothetical protein
MGVPYVNQIDNAPRRNDCGPACVAMLAGAVKPGLATSATVTDLSTHFDASQDGTTQADLLRMGDHVGVSLRATTTAEYPYIALVDYRMLPLRYQAGGDFAHWIVRLSATSYHDPLWRGADGASLPAAAGVLDAAESGARRWSSIVPNRVTLKNPMTTPAPTSGKARIKSTPYSTWKLRKAPSTSSSSETGYWLSAGQEIDVLDVASGDGWQWARVRNTSGGAVVQDGYVRRDAWEWVSTPPPPPPPPTTRPPLLLGVHFHDSRGHHYAQGFLSAGGMGATIMEGYTFASQLKIGWPKAAIFVRRWWPGNYLPPVDLNLLWGAEDPKLIYLSPINEADCIGQDMQDIRPRAEYDAAMARLVKERTGGRFNASTGRWEGGAIYVASPYSMGTPDFTRQDVRDQLRQHLAPHYNSNLLAYGYHSYSPDPAHIDRPSEWPWYERRCDFLFQKCGFNPDPSLAGVYMDETGVDTMGRGGYLAWNMDGAAVAAHLRKLCDALRSPLVVNGKSYPSPYRAATVFAATDDVQRWGGYRVQGFLGEIAQVAQEALR